MSCVSESLISSVQVSRAVTDNELLAGRQLDGVPRVSVIEMFRQQDVTDVLSVRSELLEFVATRHQHVVTYVHRQTRWNVLH